MANGLNVSLSCESCALISRHKDYKLFKICAIIMDYSLRNFRIRLLLCVYITYAHVIHNSKSVGIAIAYRDM